MTDEPFFSLSLHAKTASGRDPAACNRAHLSTDPCHLPDAREPKEVKPPLVAIVGPTASGKSALAIYLAERLNGEIINYDSVQVYRGLDIGSGKVSWEEKLRVPHHLLDVIEPNQPCTAGYYRSLALQALSEVRQRGKLPLLVGGTGLYLRALLEGLFDGPARSVRLRARLREMEIRRGREFLHKLLRRLDARASTRIHPNDTQKIIRAIEISLVAGEPVSALHERGRTGLEGFTIAKIGLSPARDELVRRIDQRVQSMFASGLVEETRALIERGGELAASPAGALLALGYRQACAVLRGDMDTADAIRDTQAATRRYAKRQMTWFRRESDVRWFEGFGDDPDIQLQAFSWLRRTIAGGSI